MKPKLKVTLQVVPQVRRDDLPQSRDFRRWLKAVLTDEKVIMQADAFAITICLVGRKESAALNLRYRKKVGATNILSFNYDLPKELNLPLTGDLVISMPVVRQEAGAQHKTLIAHCAHLTIHGMLHLLGYTHNNAKNAKIMEDLESRILKKLAIAVLY